MIQLVVILFLTNFLRTLLFIVIVYYVIRFINRQVLPFLKGTSNVSQRPGNSPNRRPEGDIRVEQDQQQNSRVPKDEGEYVDFEEID